jgi:hypothetical protein
MEMNTYIIIDTLGELKEINMSMEFLGQKIEFKETFNFTNINIQFPTDLDTYVEA